MTQCYAVHAFRELARLCRAAGEPPKADEWSGHADELTKAFIEAFWREDHFGEYVHPERGLVDSHGLSDVNWAAVAFGVADGPEARTALGPADERAGVLVGRHADAERHQAVQPTRHGKSRRQPECRVDPLNDVAAMGRVWYLEAVACQRMNARDRLVESVRKVCRAAKADGYWRERYHPKARRHRVGRRGPEVLRIRRPSWCGPSSAILESSGNRRLDSSWTDPSAERSLSRAA